MFTITYSSFTNKTFDDTELGNLLIHSRESNLRSNITGALLFCNGRFVEVLEGPECAVRESYAKIFADPRHTIKLAIEGPIAARRFTDWTMGYTSLDSTFKLALKDHDNPYESLAPSLPRGENSAQDAFDWLYESWLGSAYRTEETVLKDGPWSPEGAQTSVAEISIQLPKTSVTAVPSAISETVSTIFDRIIGEVNTGRLRPGDRMNDNLLAKRYGVSRTPVREAILKLRDIGVIEVSANRYTRIAVVGEDEANQQLTVWSALYGALLDEVVGQLSGDVLEDLRIQRITVMRAIEAGDTLLVACATVEFFMRLVAESCNPALRKNLYSVAQVVKLASPSFERMLATSTILTALDEVIIAVRDADLMRAKHALAILSGATSALSAAN